MNGTIEEQEEEEDEEEDAWGAVGMNGTIEEQEDAWGGVGINDSIEEEKEDASAIEEIFPRNFLNIGNATEFWSILVWILKYALMKFVRYI